MSISVCFLAKGKRVPKKNSLCQHFPKSFQQQHFDLFSQIFACDEENLVKIGSLWYFARTQISIMSKNTWAFFFRNLRGHTGPLTPFQLSVGYVL